MGYDMYVRELPKVVAEAKAKAYTPGGYDKEACEQLWKLEKETNSYFRFNIWGMGTCRDEMETQGLLIVDAEPPDWPAYPGDEHFDSYDGKPIDEVGRRYEEAAAYVKSAMFADGTLGVPYYKFCSNDGWVVTPEECRWVGQVASRLVVTSPDGWEPGQWQRRWEEWLNFIADAEERGGFEVW